jgi:hypothetical protein
VVHDLPPGPEEHVERLLIDAIADEDGQPGVADAGEQDGPAASERARAAKLLSSDRYFRSVVQVTRAPEDGSRDPIRRVLPCPQRGG